jgi:hypothetical protein
MFTKITRKTQEVQAVVGATIATARALNRERREIIYLISVTSPDLSKAEQKALARKLFIFKVNMGMIHT